MKYPKTRKSPIRHTVHSHTRRNRRVSSYLRGHGKPTVRVFRRRLHSTTVRRLHNPLTRAEFEKEKRFGGYYEIRPDGTAVFHPGKYQKEPTMINGKLWIPAGAKEVVLAEHNPGNPDKFEYARHPYFGTPLEPAKEYGKTILYDPYTGTFVYVTPEGEAKVTPRYTEVHRKTLRFMASRVSQAKRHVETEATLENVESALQPLYQVRTYASSTLGYPEARLYTDPTYGQVGMAISDVENLLISAKRSAPLERKPYLNRARQIIVELDEAMKAQKLV